MKTFKKLALLGLLLSCMLACNLPQPGPTSDPPAPETPAQAVTEVPPTLEAPAAPFPGSAPLAPTELNVPLRIHNPGTQDAHAAAVTSGVPLPQGLGLSEVADLQLVTENGTPIATQFTPLARWGGAPEDSEAPIRWVLLDFQLDVPAQSSAFVYLQTGGPSPQPASPLRVNDSGDVINVDGGAGVFSINKQDGSLNAPGLAASISSQVRDAAGTRHAAAGPLSAQVTLAGPLRTAITLHGSYGNGLEYTTHLWFYAGHAQVRVFHTLENNTPCPLVEYGQLDCYDIGSGGSINFRDLSFVVPTDLGPDLTLNAGLDHGNVTGDLNAAWQLVQNSSGSEHWDTYANFSDWEGRPLDTRPRMQAYVDFRGYRVTQGEETLDSGDRAAGWLSVNGEKGSWSIGVRDFWQNFPKTLRANPDGTLEIALFPEEFGAQDYTFSLRAGEHKTHELFFDASSAAPPTDVLFAAASAQWYIDSGAFGRSAPLDRAAWPAHEDYLASLLDSTAAHAGFDDYFATLPDAIAGSDFYGIFDYGDWPADYEGYEVAPLNTKYDSNYGAWLQWARSADPRWFELATAANRHLADIDILHNRHTPRHWGDGIAFGHSWHDEDGFLNPHRNGGGNHPDTAFGVPGLLLTYYLSGYEKAHAAALELADSIEYRLRNDLHLCDAFAECNGEGYGLGESAGLYDDGSRPAANGLEIAVAAYRASGDSRYLEVADAVVNWARAAQQPYINGPTGTETVVKPWTLNLYLRALADYIDMRAEFGLPDSYNAADSYLQYANWLRSYAWLELDAKDGHSRAAYPYTWWDDERRGDPSDEWSFGNNVPSVNNWLLLGADGLAYAYTLSGERDYLDRAATLFYTGSRDPWYEDDSNIYAESKEAINSMVFGNTFLQIWGQANGE